jgi:hypothetical protein
MDSQSGLSSRRIGGITEAEGRFRGSGVATRVEVEAECSRHLFADTQRSDQHLLWHNNVARPGRLDVATKRDLQALNAIFWNRNAKPKTAPPFTSSHGKPLLPRFEP